MTTFMHNGAVVSAEKATEIMNQLIAAGNFTPDTFKGACEVYAAMTTPPAPVAVEPEKKARKPRKPNAPGSQQGWAAGVTREEYSNWLATLGADYTGKRNSYAYRDIRDGVTPADPVVSSAGNDNISASENSNDAQFPPAPPSTEEIHGANQQQPLMPETDDLEAIVKAEEEKHAVLAGVVKPGTGKKKKS